MRNTSMADGDRSRMSGFCRRTGRVRLKASKFSRVPPGRRHEAAEFPRFELVVRPSRTFVHHRGIRDDERWPPALAEPEELENRAMLVG